MANTNFSQLLGIHSVAAAVIFLVLYIPLFFFWLVQTFASFSYLKVILALFCQVRLVSFVLRIVLAASKTAGENQSLFIADFVLFNGGFAWVIYCAYATILDRQFLDSGRPSQPSILGRVVTNRYLIHAVLSTAIALSAVGGVDAVSSNPSTRSNAIDFRRGSIYIYLAVVVLLSLMVVRLFYVKSKQAHVREHNSQREASSEGVGARFDAIILSAIAVLFLARESFYAATAAKFVTQNKETLWYPLIVTTEYLALCLMAAPGLIPSRAHLRAHLSAISQDQSMELKA